MARVALEKVNKVYGTGPAAVHAVEDLDLEIADGEFVALLGPSGCGKTSTLRMIVGLETVSSGAIRFDGEDVTALEPQARNVAMAFETYALYPSFTVEENLAFPLEARGVPPERRREAARRVAELLRIEGILDQKPPALSGGQQQRVSLGRALIREPAVFILDEVMSHLDAHLKFQMLFDLKRLHRELGRTMVYVTHDQVEALALADRIAVMSNARLQQVGDRNTLYNRPANRFVADFIGEPPTNFFDAEVRGEGTPGATRLAVPGSALEFALGPELAAEIARRGIARCTVGVRPQNFRLVAADGAGTGVSDASTPLAPAIASANGSGSRIRGEVRINEYLGERSILTVGDGEAVFRALVPPETRAAVGETVALECDTADVMVFDAVSEERVAIG